MPLRPADRKPRCDGVTASGVFVPFALPGERERSDLETAFAALEPLVAEAEKELVADVPMGRVVKPEDVADLCVFLASARAGMITGCAINVDGGRTRGI